MLITWLKLTWSKQRKANQLHPLHAGECAQAQLPRSSTLDWQFPSEAETWEPLVAQQECVAANNQRVDIERICSRAAVVGLVILVFIAAMLYLWNAAEGGAQMLEAELLTTIAAEAQPAQPPLENEGGRYLPTPPSQVETEEITFHSSAASVLVHSRYVETNGQSYSLRQRRFYERTATGWVRVPPNSDYLGSPRSFDTGAFSFAYHQLDAASVEAVAAEIDALYTDLRRDYGLPPAVERKKVVLFFAETETEFACHQPHHLCIPSPALASLPTKLAESEALYLWLLDALIDQVSEEAMEASPLRYEWRDYETVLPRLQMRLHSALLSTWHTDLVRWLYGIQGRTPEIDTDTLAQELAPLCNVHQILAYREFLGGNPLLDLCTAPVRSEVWFFANTRPPNRLSQLYRPDSDWRDNTLFWRELLDVEVLLDYVVATYGHETLPAIIEGFRRYDSWNTLIPAVFGISAEEFEHGWQEYLQTYH